MYTSAICPILFLLSLGCVLVIFALSSTCPRMSAASKFGQGIHLEVGGGCLVLVRTNKLKTIVTLLRVYRGNLSF